MSTQGAVLIRGVGAAPGIAQGPWLRFERSSPARSSGRSLAPEAEVARLIAAAEAVAVASERLADEVVRAGHPDEAKIFLAHAMIARDPELVDAATTRIRTEDADGSAAITGAATAVAHQLRALGDDLLAARASDVIDVGDRIARELAGLPAAGVRLIEPSVVVAEDLPPSVTATLPRDLLLGIALEASSPTAHAAILARAYGIPAVVGAAGLLAALDAAGRGVAVALDGASGEIVVAPGADDIRRYAARAEEFRESRDRDVATASLPVVTVDGTAIDLMANIGSADEADAAIKLGAHGVGLLRTEFLFLERSTPPSEDEQTAAYSKVVAAFAPYPVTIRLLDVGGDKMLPYLPIAAEDNPFLGVRALRLAENRPDLFVTQLRACYRAAARGRVKIMAPMIADAGDAATFRRLADRARTELHDEGRSVGQAELAVMLEIPSAILTADSYLRDLSFASLGTNDLLQYTLAADRGNPALERYRDSLHPALLQLVRLAVEAAERSRVQLSVCGEMAGDPLAALALVGLGVRSLSMVAPSIPAVAKAIRGTILREIEHAAVASLTELSAARVRSRMASVRHR